MQILIAGIPYELELSKPDRLASASAYGAIDHDEARIWLDSGQPEWSQKKTLLHELIHAADKLHGAKELTEEQVLSLENGLWAIFQSNPGLANVIFGKGKLQ